MTVFTPNIIISKNYKFMNEFMEGKYFSDLPTKDLSYDSVVFNGEQNKYIYNLEHSFNFNNSDLLITLKVLDADGKFENQFFNEDFYKNLMNDAVEKFLTSQNKLSSFNEYVSPALNSKLRIYLAYGIGDNLDNWTDPICCTLVGSNIEISNNGLRTYTYKFQPQLNNFFRSMPEKDSNDPNRDIDFDFAAGNVETISTLSNLNAKDALDFNYTIDYLLGDFVSKITNVEIGNVITLLPDISYKPPVLGINGSPVQSLNSQCTVYSVFSIRWEVKPTLPKEFTVLSVEKRRDSLDVATEQEREAIKKLEERLDALKQRKSQLTKGGESLLKEEARNKKLKDFKEIKQNEDKIKKIDDKLLNLGDYLDVNAPGLDDKEKSRRINHNLLRNDLERQKRELIVENEKLSKTNKSNPSLKQTMDELDNTLKSTEKVLEVYLDEEVSRERKEKRQSETLANLTLRSSKSKKDSQSSEIPLPDWRNTINLIFEGINKINNQLNKNSKNNGYYAIPDVSFETNLKWLKLFKKYKLIKDETRPAIIVGDRQAILDYIYLNQVGLDSDKTKFNNPKNNVVLPDGKIKNILESQQYKQDVFDLVFRKKSSSSFSEKINLDELALTETSKESLDEIIKIAENSDIPIFINNFRNSNVLSLSLKNTENYFKAITASVKDNRLKYLYNQLTDKQLNDLIKRSGLKLDAADLTPVQVVKEIYEKALKLIPKELVEKKPSPELLEGFKELSETKDNIFNELPETKSLDPSAINTLKSLRESLKKEKIIVPEDSSNEIVSLAIQQIIKEKQDKFENEQLISLSELIILLNASVENTDSAALTFFPTINGPDQEYILGKIHEYSKRYAVEMSLKTLPFFNLTDARAIKKPALVYSQRVNLVGNPDTELKPDFFNGEYRIVGFRHVIGRNECYSEFHLTKFGAK